MEYRIRALKVGGVKNAPLPEMLFMTGWGQWIDLNVYVWVIEGGERPVVVDTGIKDIELLTQTSIRPSRESVEERGNLEIHRWMQSPEERTDVALRKIGVKPKDVGHVILTHLHYDHFSNISLFPNAKIVVSRKGLSEAVAPKHPQIGGAVPKDALCDLISRQLELVQLAGKEEEVLPGIRVFWIGGHTPADQAVSIQTSKGKAIITSDTVFLYRNIEENIPIGFFYNLEECYDAMERIRTEADIILPAHDPEVLTRHPSGRIP